MSKRILVLDDDTQLCALLAEALSDEGYRVLAYTSAGTALAEQKRGEGVDLVVLDVYFPEMSGVTFLKRYRELDGHAKALIITGASPQHTAVRDANADGFLAKPFDLEGFLRAVRDLVQDSA